MFELKSLQIEDCEIISNAFRHIGWNKPVELFQQYHKEQSQGLRRCFVAFLNNDFTGYCTILHQSKYENFVIPNIVEISDLNVLPIFRKKGLGTALINECEKTAKQKLNAGSIGLGVGLTTHYSDALSFYLKLGYCFDKKGIAYSGKTLEYNSKTIVDDELNLYLTKKL